MLPLRPASTARRGYTLLEMILVLSVLLVVAGISWPVLERMSGDHRLKQSADEVRQRLVASRLDAVDFGVARQFRYEPEAQRYLAIPFERSETDEDGSTADSVAALSGGLPEELRFQSAGTEEIVSERVGQQWLEGLPDAYDLAQSSWSPPIVFYPDGSASSAAFRITDEGGKFIELSVRDLTGAVSVSRVQQESER